MKKDNNNVWNVWGRVKDSRMNVENGFVDISDPAYKKKVWCRRNNVCVKAGKYCCIEYKSENIGFNINIAIAIMHEDYVEEYINSDKWFFSESCIGVDSARAGFFIDYDGEYSHCNELTGVYDNAYFEYTLDGDGTYPVYYILNDKAEIVAIKIVFIPDNEILKKTHW